MKNKNIVIVMSIFIIFVFQIFSFLYLINTRPRIEFIPDIKDKNYMWSKYKNDPFGLDYPYLRIYNENFFSNDNSHTNIFQRLFESPNYWEGRITDMETFLINYGWRREEKPLFNELLINKGTIVEMKFGDIPLMSVGYPKEIKIKEKEK